MLLKLFFLFLIYNISASPVEEPSARIRDGIVAARGQFPWQAALFTPTNHGLRFCGGALISELWVLTSAWCIYEGMFRIRVLLGTTQSGGNDPDQVEYQSNQWVYYSGYDPYRYEGDIGLVKLPEAVTFTDYIKPITLNYQGISTGTTMTVSGWGQTYYSGPRPADLLYSDLVLVPHDNCSSLLVTYETICAQPVPDQEGGAQNVCIEDNGNPLVVNATSDEPVHVGIVSWYRKCDINDISGFVSTAYYRYWIFTETGV